MQARAEGRSFSRLHPAVSCSGLPFPRGRPGGLLGGPRGRRIIAYYSHARSEGSPHNDALRSGPSLKYGLAIHGPRRDQALPRPRGQSEGAMHRAAAPQGRLSGAPAYFLPRWVALVR